MCVDSPGFATFTLPVREPMIMLCWGDESVTTVRDDQPPTFDGMNSLQRQLMALRLRHVADVLDPPKHVTAARLLSGGAE